MNGITLTPEQRQRYFETMDKYSRIRCLSQEEKEDLILRITSSEYIDLMCDWAFKHVIMDVLCHTETEHIIVEMQKSKNNEFRNRMVYYGGCMISRQLKPGDKYDKLKPVYVVCFMNFRLLHQTDQLAVYLCELPRFVKEEDRPLNPVEEWFDLLQNMTKFVGRPKNVNKRFDSILEDCRQNRLDAKEREQYFNAMISEHEEQSIAAAYKEEGFLEGIEKGEDNKAKEIARRMLSRKMPIPDVAELVGMEVSEVEKLK